MSEETHAHYTPQCGGPSGGEQLLDAPDRSLRPRVYGVMAVGSLALGSIVGVTEVVTQAKYGIGDIRSFLNFRSPIAAEVAHDAGLDAPTHTLRLMGALALGTTLNALRHKISKGLNMAAGAVVSAGYSLTLALTGISAVHHPERLNPLEADQWFSGSKWSPAIGLVGNSALAAYFFKRSAGDTAARVQHTREHVTIDKNEAKWRLAGTLIHPLLETAAGAVFGVRGLLLGGRMLRDPHHALEAHQH